VTESIMKVYAAADHGFDGDMWLESYDVDAEPSIAESILLADGAIVNGAWGGRIWLTTKRDEAHKFASGADALEAWNTVSKTRPVRPDGRPNKPLAALTITVEPARLS
jgi:hypothetical protein